jgi:hypothetical protein
MASVSTKYWRIVRPDAFLLVLRFLYSAVSRCCRRPKTSVARAIAGCSSRQLVRVHITLSPRTTASAAWAVNAGDACDEVFCSFASVSALNGAQEPQLIGRSATRSLRPARRDAGAFSHSCSRPTPTARSFNEIVNPLNDADRSAACEVLPHTSEASYGCRIGAPQMLWHCV